MLNNRFRWALLLSAPLLVLAGFMAGRWYSGPADGAAPAAAAREPLYWVAPMDPDFRRPGPGLSPMGMALVPVYAGDEDPAPGTVSIRAAVENQLGVTQAPVQLQPLWQQLRVPADVSADPQQRWQVQVRSEGWIEQQQVFAVGETVQAGQVLFSYYSPRLVSAQEELLSALQVKQAALIRAAENRLLALGVSREWLRQLQQDGRVRQAVNISAPRAGVITALNLAPGARVMPEQTLVQIDALHPLWVSVRLPAGTPPLEAGAQVELRRRDGLLVQASVAQVYPLLSGAQRTQEARVVLDNSGGQWRPGDFAEAIVRQPLGTVLQVPASALIDDGHQPRVVLALGQGRFRSVPVRPGRSGWYQDSPQVEILAGLQPGQQVVTQAQFLLDSESSVRADLSRLEERAPADPAHRHHAPMDHAQMDHSPMDHSPMDHSPMDHSPMDHSQMDHSQMDHSQMDHSQMDHSQMDHSQMDHSQMDHSQMDHSQMDHSQMDHAPMDHSPVHSATPVSSPEVNHDHHHH